MLTRNLMLERLHQQFSHLSVYMGCEEDTFNLYRVIYSHCMKCGSSTIVLGETVFDVTWPSHSLGSLAITRHAVQPFESHLAKMHSSNHWKAVMIQNHWTLWPATPLIYLIRQPNGFLHAWWISEFRSDQCQCRSIKAVFAFRIPNQSQKSSASIHHVHACYRFRSINHFPTSNWSGLHGSSHELP